MLRLPAFSLERRPRGGRMGALAVVVALGGLVASMIAMAPAAPAAPAEADGRTPLGQLNSVIGPGLVPTVSPARAQRVSFAQRFGLSAADLMDAPGVDLPLRDAKVDQEFKFGGHTTCQPGRCPPANPLTNLPPLVSPAPTTRFTLPGVGVIDPQVAAGPSTLIVTMRHLIRFYQKNGQSLPNLDGTPNNEFMDLCDFFPDSLIDAMNADLNLPTRQTDEFRSDSAGKPLAINVANGYGINCDDFKGNTFYDARVLWDPFRKRFWVGALVINQKTSPSVAKGEGVKLDPDVSAARRGRFAVGVSRTGDPRKGWDFTFADVNYENDRCPSATPAQNGRCAHTFVSDYPAMGISPKYLTVSMEAGKDGLAGGPAGGRVQSVFAIPADPLASTGKCSPCLVQRPAGAPGGALNAYVRSGRLQQTVMHHPPANLSYSQWISSDSRFFVDPAAGLLTSVKPVIQYYLQTLTLVDNGTATPYFTTSNTFIQPSQGLIQEVGENDIATTPRQGALQKRHPDLLATGDHVPRDAAFVHPSFGYTQAFGATQRGATTHVVMDECLASPILAERCLTTIRYLRLQSPSTSVGVPSSPFAPLAPSLATRFGGYVTEGKTLHSGFPFVAVNRDNDAVVSHVSAGADIYTQARYTVIRAGSNNALGGRVFQDGDYTLGNYNGTTAPATVAVPHYIDASVDPFDDTAVWVLAPYATKLKTLDGVWGAAIGKVFGVQHPDRSVEALDADATDVYTGGGYRTEVSVSYNSANFGDGQAPATGVTVRLLDRTCTTELRKSSANLLKLDAGQLQAMGADFTVPKVDPNTSNLSRTRCVEVKITPAPGGAAEYDTANNTARTFVVL